MNDTTFEQEIEHAEKLAEEILLRQARKVKWSINEPLKVKPYPEARLFHFTEKKNIPGIARKGLVPSVSHVDIHCTAESMRFESPAPFKTLLEKSAKLHTPVVWASDENFFRSEYATMLKKNQRLVLVGITSEGARMFENRDGTYWAREPVHPKYLFIIDKREI
jgi:hypothetical protein